MANSWPSYELAQVAEVTDYVANGSFEALRTNVRYSDLPDYAILVRLVDYNSHWKGPFVYVDRQSYGFLKKSALVPGDIVISNVGANAGTVFEVPNVEKPMTLGPNAVLIRPKGVKRYFYYYFRSSFGQHQIQSIVSGSAQPKFNKTDLRKLHIPLPPENEQQAIAHILGTLDDKIELNWRMNETLEAMAQALFRSWFVDFDPVRAKAEGRDPVVMDAETAALFPSSIEESEIGEIPSGWQVSQLGEIAINQRRVARPEEIDTETAYIGLEHMPRMSIALGEWGRASEVISTKSRFQSREILFGKLRPYFHKVGVAATDGVCSTDILVIAPRDARWYGIVLCLVSSTELVNYADAASDGTKMPRTNWNDLSRYQIVKPPDALAQAFTDLVNPIVEAICGNIHQSRTLSAIRDALLPKLLSGEIRVTDAEQVVSAAM